jgi:membrane protein DedA with SNARE-associated domain
MGWAEAQDWALALLQDHGLWSAFLFLLVEEAGLPIPLPGDAAMVAMGVQARQGLYPLWLVIAALEAATVAGASFLYLVARAAGGPLVARYGRWLRLSPERLERSAGWLRRHGFWAVVLGRLLPGLRIVTAIACGVCQVPARTFIPAMAAGAALYITLYTVLGFVIGPVVLATLDEIGEAISRSAGGAVLVLSCAAALLTAVVALRRLLQRGWLPGPVFRWALRPLR